LRLKGETVEEIAAAAGVMRELATPVDVSGPQLVDTCGTGGDGRGTINVSTAAAIVAAAAGLRIAKHGNRSASGGPGSADVLEAVGVKIALSPEGVQRCLAETGFGFMFAQVFHPAMRHAAVPRREIGIRTIFNILGPLTNPAGAQAQVLGVSDHRIGEKMAEALNCLGTQRAMVVYGMDGVDELSISAPTRVWDLREGRVSTSEVTPEEAGLSRASTDDIKGGTVERNAELLRAILGGKPGPALDVVLLNTAAALLVGGKATTLRQGVALARQFVASGAAAAKLEQVVKVSQGLS
ncbi:MAG: anthranilate phosphoribosyltransferase, partial [Chloroflexi bacterium]|nr:anthranilate phosphoribosyltransferase [Chloroflexota bacterium]